jgi:hypothetical protein
MQGKLDAFTAIFSLFAAWAWLKSAILAGKWRTRTNIIDRLLNRISTEPTVWNAIAAGLAACAAVCQGLLYVFFHPV